MYPEGKIDSILTSQSDIRGADNTLQNKPMPYVLLSPREKINRKIHYALGL